MDLAPGAEGPSCHAIVILEFTSMALLAFNKQDREGQIPALEEIG